MEDKTAVNYKLMEGQPLDLEEFKVAIRHNLLGNPVIPKDEDAWVRHHHNFMCGHYRDKDKQGYMCGKHPTRGSSENAFGFVCGFGFHTENLNPKFLTLGNIGFLVHYFGPEVLDSGLYTSSKAGGK